MSTTLNASAPVNGVPDELLEGIFHYVKQDSNHSLREWLRVAAVCRRWRAVVMNAPLLWNMIQCDNFHMVGELNIVQVCLERSQHTSLSVSVDQECVYLS